ncbi:MAG: chorismate--pyruvate lyase [Gammaproteobacteria bacterium]|nr:chorismate lyase [Gammaproteobacteria bacterium]PCH63512.1 MAG: chorismate--pyruvate lyase [Gammaproteobacteria bacterium]PCH64982.1 MAG: chorismate--pyruvate lyase [Gammaproteobacteria bacterium]
MQVRWGSPKQEPHWHDLGRADKIPVALNDWLLTKGSLTQKVIARCRGHFHLEIVRHGWARAQLNERRLLLMSDSEWALCREVALCCDKTPLIFARTIIPNSTLKGSGRRLSCLGRKPLGELLFRDRSVLRSDLQIACVENNHSMFEGLAIKTNTKDKEIWGRRSVFFFAGQPLLVSEMFLPAIRHL